MKDASTMRILSVGARSPLGLSALQVAMNTRAQKIEPRSTPFLDERRSPIGAIWARYLANDLHGFERFVGLGVPALREAVYGLNGRAPLVLALPYHSRPDQSARFEGEFLAELARQSGAQIDLAASTVVRADNAGFGFALRTAAHMLAAGRRFVIVGGIDTYYDPRVLEWLDADLRLHSLHSDEGMVPSEGAAFCVVARADCRPAEFGLKAFKSMANIAFVGTSYEETIAKDQPNIGRAMTALAHAAITTARDVVSWTVTDVNGERYRVRESSLVDMRIAPTILPMGRNDEFAREFGDVGAATGALYLAVAIMRIRTRAVPSTNVLIMNYAEGPERAAFLAEVS